MKQKVLATGGLAAVLFLSGCSAKVELVGYGPPVSLQYGLETHLISSGKEGALLFVTNRTADVLSVNQSPLAMTIRILCEGKVVQPSYRIMAHMNVNPSADSFVLMAPGQTREIPVLVSSERGEYRTLYGAYRLKKGKLYDVDVQLNPYFGTFTKETSARILSEFKIPNYRHRALRSNTMIIRATRAFALSR
jgi:hypothetical protein